MSLEETIMTALATLPCPVCQEPAGGKHDTYVTFNEVLALPQLESSGEVRRVYHMAQIHAFSRMEDGTHRTIMDQAVRLLRGAGVRVQSWGPDEYEQETGYHHIAATCVIMGTT